MVAERFLLASGGYDIDNLEGFRYARIRPSSSTSASGLPFTYWFVLLNYQLSYLDTLQIAIASDVKSIKIRLKWDGVWGNWTEI